jgi:hypothetical protein
MYEQIRVLEQELESLRKHGGQDTSFLAQGTDSITVFHILSSKQRLGLLSTWNEVFLVIANQIVDYSTTAEVKHALNKWISESVVATAGEIADESFNLIKLQFVCLGLIAFSLMTLPGPYSGAPSVTRKYWTLTDRGRQALAELAGIKKMVN